VLITVKIAVLADAKRKGGQHRHSECRLLHKAADGVAQISD
jgi:hypothetical protein